MKPLQDPGEARNQLADSPGSVSRSDSSKESKKESERGASSTYIRDDDFRLDPSARTTEGFVHTSRAAPQRNLTSEGRNREKPEPHGI